MANDFKRMWTKREIAAMSQGGGGIVELPDIPSVVDETSPDFISVQGNVYYKKRVAQISGLINTTWVFNEEISFENEHSWNINFTSYAKGRTHQGGLEYTSFVGLNTSFVSYMGNAKEMIYVTEDNVNPVVYQAYWEDSVATDSTKTIFITGGDDVTNADLIAFLESNATPIESDTTFIYSEIGDTTQLERVIPTDVNIVKNQGEWQIQLEHDTNVLSVTDISTFVDEITMGADLSTPVTSVNGVLSPSLSLTATIPNNVKEVKLSFLIGAEFKTIMGSTKLLIEQAGSTTQYSRDTTIIIPYINLSSAGTTATIDNYAVNIVGNVVNHDSMSVTITLQKIINAVDATIEANNDVTMYVSFYA